MQDRIGEPMIEILAAAFTLRHRILRPAIGAVGRALDADVEMVVVSVIGPHLVEPASIIAGLAAQRLLDGGVDEDALDDRVLGGRLDGIGRETCREILREMETRLRNGTPSCPVC